MVGVILQKCKSLELSTFPLFLLIDSYATSSAAKTSHAELRHGKELRIVLPSEAVKLEFASKKVIQTGDKSQKDVLWAVFSPAKRGKVVVNNNKKKEFIINSVTYDDEGFYTVQNIKNEKIATHIVTIVGK